MPFQSLKKKTVHWRSARFCARWQRHERRGRRSKPSQAGNLGGICCDERQGNHSSSIWLTCSMMITCAITHNITTYHNMIYITCHDILCLKLGFVISKIMINRWIYIVFPTYLPMGRRQQQKGLCWLPKVPWEGGCLVDLRLTLW